MRKIGLLLFLLFGLAIISCDNENEQEFESQPETERHYTLMGEWIWLGSGGGFDGETYYTPENTGINLSLTFLRKDSALIIENSDTVFKAEYYVRKENKYGREMDILYFNSDTVYGTIPGFFFIVPPEINYFLIWSLTDTLELADDCCDGFGHTFKRNTK
ncbi:hypothetical protein ACFLS4_03080 [Bacteroidota bacterium]